MQRRARRATPSPDRLGVGLFLGGLTFLVYLTNLRPMGAIDTMAARWLPFSVVGEGDFDLDEFPWLQREDWGTAVRPGRAGQALSNYPVATPLLVAPLAVPALAWMARQDIDDDDVRFRLVAIVVERVGAAAIAALSVALVYLGACALTTSGLAAGIALAYGLSTGTWVTSSQALWQHGLCELGLAGLSLCLLRSGGRHRLVAAGGFAALGVAARPTMAIFALLGLIYVWRTHRRDIAAFLALPIVVAGLLLAYNIGVVGAAAGGYSNAGSAFGVPWPERLLGLLLSPNRGLFIYTPAAALALLTLLLRRRGLAPWLGYLFAGMGAYLLLYASFHVWWGGNVYGPRYFVDMLPAAALCAAPAVEMLWRSRAGRAGLAALVAWGGVVQAVGVYCDDGSWNVTPYTITYKPQRTWDWSDLQIVRAATAGWHGTDLAPLLWQMIAHPQPALLRPMPPEALAGVIAIDGGQPLSARRGTRAPLRVSVRNDSALAWPAFSDFGRLQVGVLARWWRDGVLQQDVGQLIALPRNVGPGESAEVRVGVEVPRQPGDYELDLSVVQELDLTHGTVGSANVRLPVLIE